MEKELEDTATTLRRIAPGIAWMPKWLRDNFTAAGAWSLIAVAFGAGVSWGYLSYRLTAVEEHIGEVKEQVKETNLKIDALGAVDKQLYGIGIKLDDLASRVKEQQDKWDKVEGVANMPNRRRR